MLYLNVVSSELSAIARVLTALPEVGPFRMVDGTALALQIGHRQSVDIDLFSNDKINKRVLATALGKAFPGNEFYVTDYKVESTIRNVKVELYDDWSTPFRHESLEQEGLRLASLKDIASLKLEAIIQRREKKGYIDLYFLIGILCAQNILSEFRQSNPYVSLKSVIFALGEVAAARENKSVMPKMIADVSWPLVEESMLDTARQFLGK